MCTPCLGEAVCLQLWSILLIRWHCAQHPGVTLTQAKDGEVCEEAWQWSGLVELALFWCNEPCGHMTAVRLYHVLSLAGPRHAGRSTWVHRQPKQSRALLHKSSINEPADRAFSAWYLSPNAAEHASFSPPTSVISFLSHNFGLSLRKFYRKPFQCQTSYQRAQHCAKPDQPQGREWWMEAFI